MSERGAAHPGFAVFAREFVRAYWETVRSGAFAMPPDEPVEETIDALLSKVSHQTEFGPAASHGGVSRVLRMTNGHGDWWLFTFREKDGRWGLIGASASSYTETPHDLLGPVYAQYFARFLDHVTGAANEATRA